jgi:hypothetical protein
MQQFVARFQQQHGALIPLEKKISRRKFSPDEDDMLRGLVNQLGKSDWSLIAQHLPTRSPRQCRDRWKHYLSPEVLTGNWTEADDQLLMAKVQELGQKWSIIAQLLPGRTDIGVKNRYISLCGRGNKVGQSHAMANVSNFGGGPMILPCARESPSG